GWPDHQPTCRAQPRLGFGNCLLHALVFEWHAVRVPNILQDLWQRLEAPTHFAHRPAGAHHSSENLQGCYEAVPCGREVGQNDVAGLLAAHVEPVTAHVLDDVSVPHGRANECEAKSLQIALEPEVGHHGRHQAATGQPTRFGPSVRYHRHDLIAVDELALLVHDHDAIRVTIQRNADVRPQLADLLDQRLRSGGAAL